MYNSITVKGDPTENKHLKGMVTLLVSENVLPYSGKYSLVQIFVINVKTL